MSKIKLLDLEFQLHITGEQIEAATKQIAQRISSDYADSQQSPVLLITLAGAAPWAMLLAQHIEPHFDWGFVKCASYGESITSCGKIDMQVPPTIDFKGRDVVVVEDIVDTGITWEYLHNYLKDNGARSVRMATMCIKPEVYTKDLPVDYVAFEIENLFVVGYGLDYNQRGRNLKGIYQLCK